MPARGFGAGWKVERQDHVDAKNPIQRLDHHEQPVAERIHRILQASYRVEAGILGVAEEDFPPLRRTLAEVRASGRTFYGYLQDGEIAGVVEVEAGRDPETDLSIASLVVDPSFFKAGIGETLARFALSLASGTAQVATGAQNGPALALYAKLGFQRREVYARPGGIPVVELERRGECNHFPADPLANSSDFGTQAQGGPTMYEHLKDLTDHLDWADARLWTTVLAKEGAAEDERLLFLLHHIHLVQHAFLSVWTDQPLDPLPELDSFDGPMAVAAWGRGRIEAIRRHLAEAGTEELERVLDFPWAADLEKRFNHPLGPVQLQQTALQVALHSLHHRAQAATRLRELGGEPQPMDFIVWLWHERPAAQWPQLG